MNLFTKKLKQFRKRIPRINMKKMPKWKIALYYLFYAFVIFIFFIGLSFAWFAKDLPTPTKIANMQLTESTKIYDRTGTIQLYETGSEKRTILASDQIPQNVKDAAVATEDANFYKHHGFDTRALMSAAWSKITHKTSSMRGASTITQQYVKLSFLTSDRSFARKFKELILSIELEFMYSKDQILTMYLNTIPYGNNTSGIEAAAKMYYGKTAKELTLAQAATLTAIPQSPTYYSPYGTHTKQLVSRKDYILGRMVTTGKITADESTAAKAEDTTTLNVAVKQRKDSILAPHFSMYVLEQVANKYGEDAIQKNGLKIITTLDYEKQKLAQTAIDENRANLKKNNAENAALVSTDPKTGQILAMVGSVDYFDTTIDGNVNVADSLRQPGSSFKVFEYATLLKQKEYSPSKILYDFQTDFGNYVPRNYNGRFNGPVTIRYALQNSLNIPAIKALALAGIDNTISTASSMGVNTLTDRSRYGLSLALGVGEIRPVEMANAYGTLANNGNHQELTPYLKITDAKGKTLYNFETDQTSTQALDPQIAYQMSNMLSDNAARTPTFGARSPLFFSDHNVAVKTGTTSNNRDGWACGYTPSLVTVVWTGNNMPTPMKQDSVSIAGPIFHNYMAKALANTANEEFKAPEGIQTVTVEKYSNKLPSEFSTETNTDIFASWQVPTEKDDIHISIKVCKGNGKLAPKDFPESLSENKTFVTIHSERPDLPSWENPVIAWANANGMTNTPPTEYCSTADVTPSMSITAPSNNATINGKTNITVDASGSPVTIASAEFYIDSISIGTSDTAAPAFSKVYDFDNLSDGSHKILVVGTDTNGITTKSTITVNVSKTAVSMGIININSVPKTNSVTISWSTNISTTGKVFYATDHQLKSYSDPDSLSTEHSIVITGLQPKTKYYYKVSATSSSETKSSDEYSFTTE